MTGATGTVGREVVRRLQADAEVRVLTRDPARVTGAGRITVVRGDYGDASSLRAALHGVSSAFLVTTVVGGDQDARFVRAAADAGVEHVVKLSGGARGAPPGPPPVNPRPPGGGPPARGSGGGGARGIKKKTK
ncbi:SDR family oxidoreductase, partial [Streptomyces rochei]|uniref:SDR family oxidoreductase n=1 Tax=Streptomyces rochei TaxID=1928 RepID=UPI0036B062F5